MSEVSPSAPETTPPHTVVVAEDETIIRLDIVESLTAAGYNVVGQAENGQRAVQLVEELSPDVVLMDISMPVMDGLEATEKITALGSTPVVILTAFSQRELIAQATEAGAMTYLVKPFKESDLVPAIELAIARFEQITALNSEVSSLADQFETRKLVERAKNILMEALEISEPDAFRWIQKTSMDRRLTMKQVAETVIEHINPRN